MRWWVGIGLLVLFVVRYDHWWWNNADLVGGLPIGLAYHLAFCAGVALFFFCVVRFAWPDEVGTAGAADEAANQPGEAKQ